MRIANCGGAPCGTLVGLKEPNDPATGRPKTDKENNADASKQSLAAHWRADRARHEAELGTPPDQWSGNVYNASDGKTYTGSSTLTEHRRAQKAGKMSVICKTQTWTQAHPIATPGGAASSPTRAD